MLHDSQRCHEGRDRDHGPRAAQFVRRLQAEGTLELSSTDLDLLMLACEGHSEGIREAPLIVQVCWDADRLDLVRVGIRPEPKRLCTVPARNPGYLTFAGEWSIRTSARCRVPLPQRHTDGRGVLRQSTIDAERRLDHAFGKE